MILTVRKKPVVVEAIFWDGKVSTMQELESMGMKYGACMQQGSKVHCLTITTLARRELEDLIDEIDNAERC
jgi:hypothetical protein